MKISKFLSCLSAIFLLFSLITSVYAAPTTGFGRPQPTVSTYNETLNYRVGNDGNITITKCVETASGDIEIPAEIDGKLVTAIGDYSFQHCKVIKSVSLPNTITEIGYSAFYGCSALESINIPDSVTKIKYGAFYFCDALKSAQIADLGAWCLVDIDGPYSNPAHIIGKLDFGTSVTELNIPDHITSIGRYTFYGCKDITTINISENVTSIGECAFYGCKNLNGITIPKGVTEIGNGAISNCPNIKSVTIADGNQNYRNINGGLVDVKTKTLIRGFNTTVIPTDGSITEIGAYAFSGCNQIASVTIPDCVTYLGSSVFENCTALTSITFPKNFTYINASLFFNCTSLTSIDLPETITSIGSSAFRGCSDLNNINFPNNLEEIRDFAFADCSSLIKIILPKAITKLGNGVFAGCTSLKILEVSEDGKYYSRNNCIMTGESVIAGCVTSRIPDFATSIGISAFEGQKDLQNINIPENIIQVKTDAFNGCENLKTIYTGYSDKKKWANIKVSSGNDTFTSAERLYGNTDMPVVPVPKEYIDDPTGDNTDGKNSGTAWIYIVIGGIFVAAIAVTVLLLTKRKKSASEVNSNIEETPEQPTETDSEKE